MGERFGKYELLSRIGVGGMAEVFHARRFGAEGFVKDVVIKRILPAFTEDADFVDMFVKEARLAVKLTHANIVQVLDFDHVDGHYYIAMEHLDGPDLRRVETVSRRRSVPLPHNLAIHVGVEALKGLHYAHTKQEGGQPLGIVHRDVSPHNLLVSYSGEVKVADFGIAKVAAMASATRPGAVKGKLTYMAPEQIRGAAIDHRADLFSLGIVLWELLSGRRLYADCGSEGEVIAAVQRAEIPPLASINSDIPQRVQAVVGRLLEPDPDKRFPHAALALAELSPVAGAGHGLEVAGFLRRLLPEGAERQHKGQTEIVARHPVRPTGPEEPTRTSEPKATASQPSLSTGPQRPAVDPVSGSSSQRSFFESVAESTGPDAVDAPPARRSFGVVGAGLVLALFTVLAWFAASHLLGGVVASPEAPAIRVGRLQLRSEPVGAEIVVDGIPLGRGPLVEVSAPAGQRLRVEARQGGHRATEQVTIEPEKELSLVLRTQAPAAPAAVSAPVPETPPVPSPTAREESERRGKRRPARRVSRRPTRLRARGHAARLASASKGTLDVIVSPWAVVHIDDRRVGTAPIKRFGLTVGRHTLRLRNDELGKDERITIVIRPGQALRIRRDWLKD